MEYELIAGLEVHTELSTKSKIYCSCVNEFGSEVNTNCCPVCTAMPGTLPVLNEKVVEYAILMGHSLNCYINSVSKQDRKNYFYPDLPKAYQISQSDTPLCEKGYIDIYVNGEIKKIGITRIHIEEDAGKLIHEEGEYTLADYNRCGVPLIEIVSEPDFRNVDEVKAYLDSIKAILEYIDISDCKMQEGSIRCDVNVSVRAKGSEAFGTRVEMKNVNTFSGVLRAIKYEFDRQIEVLESGGAISQETRRWDDEKGVSIPLRSKENSHDYRYFPEPDLLPIVIADSYIEDLKEKIPRLPNQRMIEYIKDYDLPEYDSELLAFNKSRSDFFEECTALKRGTPKAVSNWILGDISKILNETGMTITAFKPESIVDLVQAIEDKQISNTAGKTVLDELIKTDKTVAEIIKEKGLQQISDASALEVIVDEVLSNNAKSIEDYKNGKTNVLGFLVGQCMRASKGQGNPQVLSELLSKKLT